MQTQLVAGVAISKDAFDLQADINAGHVTTQDRTITDMEGFQVFYFCSTWLQKLAMNLSDDTEYLVTARHTFGGNIG